MPWLLNVVVIAALAVMSVCIFWMFSLKTQADPPKRRLALVQAIGLIAAVAALVGGISRFVLI